MQLKLVLIRKDTRLACPCNLICPHLFALHPQCLFGSFPVPHIASNPRLRDFFSSVDVSPNPILLFVNINVQTPLLFTQNLVSPCQVFDLAKLLLRLSVHLQKKNFPPSSPFLLVVPPRPKLY